MALGRGTPAPTSQAGRIRGRGFDEKRGVFLRTEEAATARLGGLYAQMRAEVHAFLRSGDATLSDQSFYAEIGRQADLRLKSIQTGAAEWVDQILPAGFVAGAELQARELVFRPVHDKALRFLSGYTLDLIQDTDEDVRRTIQQEVAQAVAGSIPREELIKRLVSSGLTRGPWRDVETRAMVIARTEQMRAYNAGNIAGIRSNGAVLGRWITSRDERVCGICGPREGQTFVLPGVTEEELTAAGAKPGTWIQLDAVTARGTDSAPPAHPRCRCTLRAQYRDADGNVLGSEAAPAIVEPEAAAGVDPDDLADAAASDADFRKALRTDLTKPDPARVAADAAKDAQLREANRLRQELEAESRLNGNTFGHPLYGGPASPAYIARSNAIVDMQRAAGSWKPTPDAIAYWRAVQMTPSRIQQIAELKGAGGQEAFRNVLARRFGMDVELPATMLQSEVRRVVLEGLELYRSKVPELVTDFAGLRGFGDRGFNSRMVGGELGTWTASSRFFRVAVGKLKAGGEYNGRGKIRGGSDVDAGLEVVTHEIGHGIFHGIVKADTRLAAEWSAIRGKTARDRLAPFDTVASPEGRALLERQIEAWKRDTRPVAVKYRQSLEQQLESVKRGPDGEEHFPTKYGRDGADPSHEDFAESIMIYILNPAKLRAYSPARYGFLRDRIFRGKEYQ